MSNKETPTTNTADATNNIVETKPNTNTKVSTLLDLSKFVISNPENKIEEVKPITAEDLFNLNFDEIPFLLDKILPKIAVGAIAGSSDTGKSAFLRQLAMAIVSDEADFLGFKINAEHKSVLYISTEDDEIATATLLKKQNHKQLPYTKFKNLRFIFNTENLLNTVTKELEKAAVDCVIIDAFTDIYGDDLNSSNKVRNFINNYYNLVKKHKCLLLFLHHTGKKTENTAPHKDNLLGSQGFEAKMRVVVEIRKDKTKEDIRHLCIVKGNYISDEMKSKSIELNFRNMVYTPTNNRVEFTKLTANKNTFKEHAITQRNKEILRLKEQNKSVREIENILKEKGHKVSKSTVNNIIAKHPKVEISTS